MTSLAACLLVVCVVAKIIVLAGRTMPDPGLAYVVLLWQDIAVVLVLALVERVVRPRWPSRMMYAGLAVLVVINVPVIRALSSPITAQMLRATGGALADSLRHYVTFANVGSIVVLLAIGFGLPSVPVRFWPRWVRAGRAWAVAGTALVVVGWSASSRIETRGLERNPLIALASTALPRVHGSAADADWRASPQPRTAHPVPDLSPLRGTAKGKNVLLVILESTGARYLRTYGASADPMPNLTALATRSIVFENAYSVYPESVKGMVATFSSQYPAFDVSAEEHAPAMQSSIARVLDSSGYATALFHSGRFMYLGMDTLVAASGFAQTEDAGAIGGNRNSSFGIDEPAAVHRVLQWIDSIPRDRPFFAAYLPVAGHHPYAYALEGPFSGATDSGRYLNAIHEGDRALGELIDGLRARGLDTSTVLVVVGDHGEAFGQHEGNFGHTLAIYEENIRVPLLIAIPGVATMRIPRVASLLDIAPTILDLLAVQQTAAYQGESLLDSRERMALFFTDYSLGLVGLRDGCAKYVHELESGRSKTFDVCIDPGETRPLPIENVVYRDRLIAWTEAQVAHIRRRGSE